MRVADLGRNLGVPKEGRALRAKPLAEHFFARAATVGVRGVEAPKPQAPRMIEQYQGLRFAVAGVAQAGRGANAAEIAAAEHDPVEVPLCQQLFRPETGRAQSVPAGIAAAIVEKKSLAGAASAGAPR